MLDIYHASQHLATAAAGLFAEARIAASEWLEAARQGLLSDGWNGLLDRIGALPTEGRSAAGQAALDETAGCFAKHTSRMQYFSRLQAGEFIGSGSMKGLAKRMGRRFKVAGAGGAWCISTVWLP